MKTKKNMHKLYVVTYQDQDDYQERWDVMVSDKETKEERVAQYRKQYAEVYGLDDGDDIDSYIAMIETYALDEVGDYVITVNKRSNGHTKKAQKRFAC